MDNEINVEGRVIAEPPACFQVDGVKALELLAENKALKAALKDVMAAVLELSNSLGPTLDAINNHAKVIMPLVNQPKEEGEPC